MHTDKRTTATECMKQRHKQFNSFDVLVNLTHVNTASLTSASILFSLFITFVNYTNRFTHHYQAVNSLVCANNTSVSYSLTM